MTETTAFPTSSGLRFPPAAQSWGIGLLLLLALAIRLPLLGLASGSYRMTEAFNIEEVENVRLSTGMLHKGTLHPHAFEYPSLFYELSLLVEAPLGALGLGNWSQCLIGVRALSLVFGLITIWLSARLATRLGGTWAGLFSAALMTCDRTMIEISTLAKPNAAQLAFVLAGFLALCELARKPRTRDALRSSAWFALAAASKWLGALGLVGLAAAPVLANPRAEGRGLRRLVAAIPLTLRQPVPARSLLLPPLAFAAVFLICVPGLWLSPKEFGFGFAQTFIAQSLHQRPLPIWMPLAFLVNSLGPVGVLAAAIGLLWGIRRAVSWNGSAESNGVWLVLGWALAYAALVLFVFARLPSYLDLWVPFLAILGGSAIAGSQGLLRGSSARAAAVALALVAGVVANGAHGAAAAASAKHDTRTAAGEWLAARAVSTDSVLADLGVYVPDRFSSVQWNWWGSPPRVVYDESATWGHDPIWPDWYGGHRRLVFENAKWIPAGEQLARRPRWVLTDARWESVRAHPMAASESAAPEFDRSLADGSAGYRLRARFVAASPPSNPWRVLAAARGADPPLLDGPEIKIWERVDRR